MMREILFRGKATSGLNACKWVEGFFVKDFWFPASRGYGIIPADNEKGGYCEVYPKTVGQYIGLTDKNGKKIFEGDIAKHFDRFYRKTVYGTVEYRYGCYVVHTFDSPNCPAIDVVMNESNVEIIGNIHDNPELLEGV